MLRTGGTASAIGCTVKAPSTLGTFLCSFRWGHVRQLDRVSRELLARAWAAGAGPSDAPFTIDLDSTICETCGLAKEGVRHQGYTGQRASPAASCPSVSGSTRPPQAIYRRQRSKIYRDSRSSRSLLPSSAISTTPFGGFGFRSRTLA